jgi:hypothetical protein
MLYRFTNINECVYSVINFIDNPVNFRTRKLTTFNNLIGKVPQRIPINNVSVIGTDRCGNSITYEMPIALTISVLSTVSEINDPIESNDPMELLTLEEWGQFMWNVEIKICPKAKRGTIGNCFYMQVFIPANNPEEGVVVSWLNQIMIDPISHAQITPKQCFVGGLPDVQWGTLFMNLYETFTMEFASQIPMPVVGGLVDDAFVSYCDGPVNFSDFRRFMGADPWYETFGFYMANIDEYKHALVNRSTNAEARASVMENYRIYKIQLNLCRESPPAQYEQDEVCKTFDLACASCPGESCMLHRDMYSSIGAQIKANNPKACQWISDAPPLVSCLIAFNRNYNSQTIRIVDADNTVNNFVVRLKFYTFVDSSYV